jgi:CheY-like chemotaxis protein
MLPSTEPEATVVVCEDDAPTLDLLCDHLEADRFQALGAPSAADALRLCHYNDPDLLLLDLRLPDASGLDVLREIRASVGSTGRFDPALPVIILSGRSTDVDRVRGFAEGADDYVVKPFHYQEVAARIRAILRRRASRREGPRRIGELFIDPARREVWVRDRAWPWPTRSSRSCARWPRIRTASSPRTSCCATSGDFGRGGRPGRLTPTPAACGESSTRKAAGTSSTVGAWATASSTDEWGLT